MCNINICSYFYLKIWRFLICLLHLIIAISILKNLYYFCNIQKTSNRIESIQYSRIHIYLPTNWGKLNYKPHNYNDIAMVGWEPNDVTWHILSTVPCLDCLVSGVLVIIFLEWSSWRPIQEDHWTYGIWYLHYWQ